MDALAHSGEQLTEQRAQQRRRRQGPNPEQPFGDARSKDIPFGLMRDAALNLKSHDRRLDKVFESVSATFRAHEGPSSKTSGATTAGSLSFAQFKAALEEIDAEHSLNLSEEEVHNLFEEADLKKTGRVDYNKLLYPHGNTEVKRFLPEFLKPKSLRRSQSGHLWEWSN